MYEARTYRSSRNEDRFSYIEVRVQETDLLIAFDSKREDEAEALRKQAEYSIQRVRKIIEDYISIHPEFSNSLVPLRYGKAVPLKVQRLLSAAEHANTGPMAGIAGLLAEETALSLRDQFDLEEIVVENGGDIFANIKSPLVVNIFAGNSPISEKVNLELPEGEWGICTSSGTVGHSLSFGKADSLSILSSDTVLADCLATGLANLLKSEEDINTVLNKSGYIPGIQGCLIIIGEKLGAIGDIKLC